MKIFYLAIDSVTNLISRNVKRDSWLWKGIREAFAFLRHNPINKRRWKSNYNRFEGMIEQYSKELHDFFVLQIGACDGVMDDPIHKWIKKYRWQGILVEPQMEEFERLKINYSDSDNLRFENVAVAGNSGLRPLFKVRDDDIESDWQRGLASLVPKPGLEKQDMGTTEMVQCVTFDTLLNRHQVKRIDLLQIDVEGYDYELLKLFDFERMKPQLIRYEHRHLKLADRSSCKKLLIQNGYRIFEMAYDTGAVLRTWLVLFTLVLE